MVEEQLRGRPVRVEVRVEAAKVDDEGLVAVDDELGEGRRRERMRRKGVSYLDDGVHDLARGVDSATVEQPASPVGEGDVGGLEQGEGASLGLDAQTQRREEGFFQGGGKVGLKGARRGRGEGGRRKRTSACPEVTLGALADDEESRRFLPPSPEEGHARGGLGEEQPLVRLVEQREAIGEMFVNERGGLPGRRGDERTKREEYM